MSYAIFKTGGKQYRVAAGDVVEIEKLDAEAGQTVTFSDVLMQASGDNLVIGSPLIADAAVKGEVVEQFKGKKVWAFKFRRRKGFHKTIGHRQKLTRVKITSVI